MIETAKKHAGDIAVPDCWIDLVKNTKKAEPRFIVTKMEKDDFFSSKSLLD